MYSRVRAQVEGDITIPDVVGDPVIDYSGGSRIVEGKIYRIKGNIIKCCFEVEKDT